MLLVVRAAIWALVKPCTAVGVRAVSWAEVIASTCVVVNPEIALLLKLDSLPAACISDSVRPGA